MVQEMGPNVQTCEYRKDSLVYLCGVDETFNTV